jgi:hypothetical protein
MQSTNFSSNQRGSKQAERRTQKKAPSVTEARAKAQRAKLEAQQEEDKEIVIQKSQSKKMARQEVQTKRRMPFLPTFIEALERQGHLHLMDTCCSRLLFMSTATADGLLRGPRTHGQRGLATTRTGTLLKQQIAIRTFQQWNEAHPGFLEADLVAHCGAQAEGSFLYTLTLTDIATGWTECFPLLTKSAEAVVSALQQARACFPFLIYRTSPYLLRSWIGASRETAYIGRQRPLRVRPAPYHHRLRDPRR